MTAVQIGLLAGFLGSGLTANLLWYRVKFLVRSKGYPISLVWHYQDLYHLDLLIEAESDRKIRSRYKRLRLGIMVGIYGMLLLFLAFLAASAMPT